MVCLSTYSAIIPPQRALVAIQFLLQLITFDVTQRLVIRRRGGIARADDRGHQHDTGLRSKIEGSQTIHPEDQ